MLGQIYSFDHQTNTGFILGQDGYRYTFLPEDFRFQTNPIVGMIVRFETEGQAAHDIVSVDRLPIQSQGETPAPTKLDTDMVGWSPPLPIPDAQTQHNPHIQSGPMPSQPMDLWQHFKRCMTVNYSQFNGRARRSEFWSFFIILWVLTFGGFLVGIAIDVSNSSRNSAATLIIPSLIVLASFIPSIAVIIRRLHDIGVTGFAALAMLVPTVNFFAFIGIGAIPGQPRDNQYGPSPRA